MPDDDESNMASRLGAALRSLRRHRGMTQAEVAERLSGIGGERVAFETISRLERGALAPSVAWVERLATLYGVHSEEVYAAALATTAPTSASPVRRALLEEIEALTEQQASVALAVLRAWVTATKRR
jgi:transcriptional regulator with XRE-family HTH domain